MRKLVNDLTGKTFGRLYVMGVDDDGGRKTKYICACDCGNFKSIRSDALLSGATKSCGCIKREQDKINLKRTQSHKQNGTRLYEIWQGMKKRCYNKNCPDYPNYGGRGIKVCDSWKNDFSTFYKWATENGYNINLSIDRINNNGGYEPNNCRWTDSKTQANNRRSNIIIRIGNRKKTLKEWCEIFNVPYKTVNARYHSNSDISIEKLFEGGGDI